MVHTPMEEVLTGGNADMLAEMVKVVPAGRFIEPEEIAAAVLWLCRPRFKYGYRTGHCH